VTVVVDASVKEEADQTLHYGGGDHDQDEPGLGFLWPHLGKGGCLKQKPVIMAATN